jgi:WD40 repeat protein
LRDRSDPGGFQSAVALLLFTSCLAISTAMPQGAVDSAAKPALFVRSGDVENIAMAASPNGLWYATLKQPGSVTLWSTKDNFEYRSFRITEPLGGLANLSISPDSQWIAVAGYDGILLFDANTTQPLDIIHVSMFGAIPYAINKVAFHPNKMLIASIDWKGNVVVNDVKSRAELFRHQIADTHALAVQFSPDGSLLLACYNNEAHVWDWSHQREITAFSNKTVYAGDLNRQIKSHDIFTGKDSLESADKLGFADFRGASFSPDGKQLALAQYDEVNVMDIESGKREVSVPVADHQILSCLFARSDEILVSVLSGTGFTVNLKTGNHQDFAPGISSMSQIVQVPHSDNLLLYSPSHTVIASYDSRKKIADQPEKLADIFSFQFSPDGKDLFSGINQWGGPMSDWSMTTGADDTEALPLDNISTFAQSPDGRLVTYYDSAGYPNFKLHVWNRETRREEAALPVQLSGTTGSIAFSPDGKWLASASGQPKTLHVWSVPGFALVAARDVQRTGSFDMDGKVAFSPDSKTVGVSRDNQLVTFNLDSTLSPSKSLTIDKEAWQGTSLAGVYKSTTPNSYVSYFSYSPDGSLIAIQGMAATHVVDIGSWKEISSIPNTTGFCVAFSPDSRFVAVVATHDQTPIGQEITQQSRLMVWDVTKNQPVFMKEDGAASCPVAFSRDGSFLAAGISGGIGIFSSGDGGLLASLYRFGDGAARDWIAVAPDGLFDGTADAWTQLSWRFSGKTFDTAAVEAFFREFFHPGLLSDIAEGRKPAAPASISQLDRVQPELSITNVQPPQSANHDVDITVHVKSAAAVLPEEKKTGAQVSGVYDVRLFRDGQIVRQWPEEQRGALEAAGALTSEKEREAWRKVHQVKVNAAGEATITIQHVKVPQRASVSKVEFTAYAFNRDRVKSPTTPPFEYSIVHASQAEPVVRRAYLVTMGVNANQSPNLNLDIAVPSAEAARSVLRGKLQADYQEVVEIQLYSDLDNDGHVKLKTASKVDLRAVFDLLAGRPVEPALRDEVDPQHKLQAAGPDDAVVLYIVSHGYADPQGNFYLMPYDTGTNWGVTEDQLNRCQSGPAGTPGCSGPRDLLAHSISSSEMAAWWNGVDATEMVMILDSCHSGAVPGKGFRPAPLGDPGFGQLSYDKGMRILSASQPTQVAHGGPSLSGEDVTFLATAFAEVAAANPRQTLGQWLHGIVYQLPLTAKENRSGITNEDVQTPRLLDFAKQVDPNGANTLEN